MSRTVALCVVWSVRALIFAGAAFVWLGLLFLAIRDTRRGDLGAFMFLAVFWGLPALVGLVSLYCRAQRVLRTAAIAKAEGR